MRDREIQTVNLYWFTLNQELHQVPIKPLEFHYAIKTP